MKEPLPEARRQAVLLMQSLLQSLHIAQLRERKARQLLKPRGTKQLTAEFLTVVMQGFLFCVMGLRPFALYSRAETHQQRAKCKPKA